LPRLQANINLLCEVAPAIEHGATGVGLYRTEFLFLARRTLPTEEEQVGTYRKLLTMLGGRPASIRTFDLRPDKMVHNSHLRATTSGPLDWRLVLESPTLQQLFRDQVRAILRAATVGPARILVPLVTRTEQLDFVVESLGRARDELTRDGLDFAADVPLGIMIEVAAAAVMADTWAPHVNYFALGTNDLVASALGIDRDDPAVASLSDPLHPAVLRTIDDVVRVARAAERPVTVCGEMAADPQGAVALAAIGVDSLSLPVNQLSAARRLFAALARDALPQLAELLGSRTAAAAREVLARRHPA
jgi:phosphoenolpyruvate-protein kinase (PTS system EI component)